LEEQKGSHKSSEKATINSTAIWYGIHEIRRMAMRYSLAIFFLCIIFPCCSRGKDYTIDQQKITGIPVDIGEHLIKYNDINWQIYKYLDASSPFPVDQVPQDVKDKADTWFKTIMKPCWIPEDLPLQLSSEVWTMQYVKPKEEDYFRVNYSTSNNSITYLEGRGRLFVL